MSYIEIYSDRATDEEIQQSLEAFMEKEDYFEASSWQIQKLPDGTFKETCCGRCPTKYYSTLGEWQSCSNVYPDQRQWVKDE